ncbi:NFX1-type zinc finger-containing protein 1-like [Stylophora pistillata]|nr:NFX1-type zinc finger-containing protein 1-like [Stylophora pistillata]XP_022807781.1 NFX1-type zinc finger-containing protein 1-like [Stylophora pistillata]
MPSKKSKWAKKFNKHERQREESKESDETSKRKEEGQAKSSAKAEGPEESESNKGACGTSADEISDDKSAHHKQDHRGRYGRKHPEGRRSRFDKRRHGREKDLPDTEVTEELCQGGARKKTAAATQPPNGSWAPCSTTARPDPPDKNQKQQAGKPFQANQEVRSQKPQVRPRGVFPMKSVFDLKSLKEMSSYDVVHKLNENIDRFKLLLRSKEKQHNSNEFIMDLTCVLAIVCNAPAGEKRNNILSTLKGSIFLKLKIPSLLDRSVGPVISGDQTSQERLIQWLIKIFTKFLMQFQSSYADIPYEQLKRAFDAWNIDRKGEIENELKDLKRARDDIIIGENQRHGRRYIDKAGHKPPNDFRDIPICPTNEELRSNERPFLRKNVTKGRYDDAEHYLDVQFRLLREDFLEPLREGIQEIVKNVPRRQKNQLIKCYPGARIVDKTFTQSGVIYHIQFDVSKFNTRRWANSKRLMYGSFLCLSKDEFKTMLFAMVANRNAEELARGKIEIRFMEEQDIFGIENRKGEYQMVESPAYFEAYRHVLRGLKEINETTLPFKKYLVECSTDVSPPEYLSCEVTQDPICYNLSEALDVPNEASAFSVPVLQSEAWPSVKKLPLNESQFEALKTALTTEFCVIQGPPGTGKTYVGAKIVRCLVENREAWDPERTSPMLMVCYTNHALDQFLEKVLEFLPKRKIIRVGGRCKSQQLEECNLRIFCNGNRMDEKQRRTLQKRKHWKIKETNKCKKFLEKADSGLLEFDHLEEHINFEHAEQFYTAIFPSKAAGNCQTPGNTLTLWLCKNRELDQLNQSSEPERKEQEESLQDQHLLYGNHALEKDEVSYYTTWSTELKGTKENTTDSQLPSENKFYEEDLSKKWYLNSESPQNQLSSRKYVEHGSHHAVSEKAGSVENAENITPLRRNQILEETSCDEVNGINNSLEETIAVEKEADRIQNQRRIQGDEIFSPVMGTVSDKPSIGCTQGHEDTGLENNEGWIPVPFRNKRGMTPWNQTDNGKVRSGNTTKKTDFTANEKEIQSVKEALKKEVTMTTTEAHNIKNIWSLSYSRRLRLYLFWVESFRERYRVELQRSEQEYEQLCLDIEAMKFDEDKKILGRATVIGMTTTGAARYHSVLQRIAPKIVVIEEAAEVMEAHIITSLSHNTKHTILIGDHKQLRPKATVYELAQKYNLEISLFERMVMNSMDCKRLSIQHRMRPEIAALTKRIYDHEIVDHETVDQFEDIFGLTRNLFFIDHSVHEVPVEGLQSYSNPHEASFLIALCNYLLLQGYHPNRITILTMYIGQLLLLQQNMPKRFFEGVRVCAVDNYQGEENDIILLSLVRSNLEGRIGFLNESNRICVALSRARQGFYCIGNFKLLRSRCSLWKEICTDLEAKEAIGDKLQFICRRHQNVTEARTSIDFNPLGGCKDFCGVRLACGHACEKPCHAEDYYHEKSTCSKQCLMICCSNGHRCLHKCHHHSKCPKCYVPMLKRLPQCGHEQDVPCQTDPENFSCKEKCEKILPCGHNCQDLCGNPCTRLCKFSCKKVLSCGHEKYLPCFKDPIDTRCTSSCTKVLECGHPCSKKCKEPCKCNTEVEVDLKCGHKKLMLCTKKDKPPPCKKQCSKELSCGHICPGMCFEDCETQKCKTEVFKTLPCGHHQSIACHFNPDKAFCYARCQRELNCGHKCPSVCGRVCDEVLCEESCQMKCERGHACPERCHFGSSCPDCIVKVDVKIPKCAHSIETGCHVDPSSLRCEKPCEKSKSCGHSCKRICGEECEAEPCQELVTITLPCGHEATLRCHKNPERYICKEKVEVQLSCGHKTLLSCHVASVGANNAKCNELVDKELPCKHKLTLPCHKRPEECKCKKKVDVQLSCGHKKSLQCFEVAAGLETVRCMYKMKVKLPCEHEATIPCYLKLEEHCCQVETEITLPCGHKKFTACFKWRGELHDKSCSERVTRKLPCGHENEMFCSDEPDNVFCNAPCERLLPCKHTCAKRCGNDCASFKCFITVQKDLPCGFHKVSCRCSDDVSQMTCLNECERILPCGHKCPGKCSEGSCQYICMKSVVKPIDCAGKHSARMICSEDPKSVICKEQCNRKLDCGHQCPGICSENCERMRCIRKVVKEFPCGHKESLRCFQSKEAICKARCQRRIKSCGHVCKGICGQDCSKYPCDVPVVKTRRCGHKIKLPCHQSENDVECLSTCEATLPCGHRCSETCQECQKSGTHELCQRPCGRILVCSHRCNRVRSEPCPPCERFCRRRCPHGECAKRCSQLCESCREPCEWRCNHYQCDNLCGEECNRPPCDAPCPKKLPCRHPCIGLCGENCPTVCAICHAKKLASILADGQDKQREATRYLQLLDCSHIITVEKMDAWVQREQDSDVQLIRCPRCSTPITFSYRYGNVIKRTLRNVETVKKQVLELANVAATTANNFLGDDGITTKNVMEMKFPQELLRKVVYDYEDWRHAPGRAIPLLFTLNNHFQIMHIAGKAKHLLQGLTSDKETMHQNDLKELALTSINGLKEIEKYLKKPQIDLKTLKQVYDHTRKFFLFSLILDAQRMAIRNHRSFSGMGELRLRSVHASFNSFLQGQDDALDLDKLERMVDLLRKEVDLPPFPLADSTHLENFPGFNRGAWKRCKQNHVYCTRIILEDGDSIHEGDEGCSQCARLETPERYGDFQDDWS